MLAISIRIQKFLISEIVEDVITSEEPFALFVRPSVLSKMSLVVLLLGDGELSKPGR